MNKMHVTIALLMCAAAPLQAFDIDVRRAQEVVKAIWTSFVQDITQTVEKQGIPSLAPRMTKQNFLLPRLKSAVDKAEFKGVVRGGGGEQAIKQMVERILSNAALELFCRETPDHDLEKLEGVLEAVRLVDEAYRASTVALRESVLTPFLRTVGTHVEQFLKGGEITQVKANELQDRIEQLFVEFPDEGELIPAKDLLHRAVGGYMYINDDKPAENVQELRMLSETARMIGLVIEKYKPGAPVSAAVQVDRFVAAWKLLFSDPKEITWCGCANAPFSYRIALALRMVNDVKKTYPDVRVRLVHTSVAAGGLLQDYLFIKELMFQGYKNLDINLIDLDIKDVKTLERMAATAPTEIEEEHDSYTLGAQLNYAFYRANFEKKIGSQFTWTAATLADKPFYKDPGIMTTIFESTQSYVRFAQAHPEFKSCTVMMVDVWDDLLSTDNAQLANALALYQGAAPLHLRGAGDAVPPTATPGFAGAGAEEDAQSEAWRTNPSVIVLLPMRAGVEAYSNLKKPYDTFGDMIIKLLTQVVQETSAQTSYNPKLGEILVARATDKATPQWLTNVFIGLYDIARNALVDNDKAFLYDLNAPAIGDNAVIAVMTGKEISAYLAQPSVLPSPALKKITEEGFRPLIIELSVVAGAGEEKKKKAAAAPGRPSAGMPKLPAKDVESKQLGAGVRPATPAGMPGMQNLAARRKMFEAQGAGQTTVQKTAVAPKAVGAGDKKTVVQKTWDEIARILEKHAALPTWDVWYEKARIDYDALGGLRDQAAALDPDFGAMLEPMLVEYGSLAPAQKQNMVRSLSFLVPLLFGNGKPSSVQVSRIKAQLRELNAAKTIEFIEGVVKKKA